jgi:phospholipid/cholesterol/gamma-HCH transport system permease protein
VLTATGELVQMVGGALFGLVSSRFPTAEFLDQCWFLIRVSALPVMLISLPFGVVIALQVGNLLAQVGATDQVGGVMVLAVVREQAPIAVALMIAGAGGSAMCADLGARKARDELDAMVVMGVNPLHRLVLPRLLAGGLVAMLLLGFTATAGILGGLEFSHLSLGVPVSGFLYSFSELSQPSDLAVSLAKAGVFGFVAAAVACHQGMTADGGPKGVGDAVNRAVVATVILLFVINFLGTVAYFHFVPQKLL